MAKKVWPFDPRTRRLLVKFLRAVQDVQKPYAIGGALAMATHGYARQTKDVDAFLQNEDRAEWFRALRQQGLDIVPLFTGLHYVAVDPKSNDPEVRIDLLLPVDDPAASAVMMPETRSIAGFTFEAFPLELLVISKVLSDRDKDHQDVDMMYERGLFEPRKVAAILQHIMPGLIKPFLEKYK